jgi:hypothetical protein
MLKAANRGSAAVLDPLNLDGLPPVLAALLRPWMSVVEAACLGMGNHVAAAAADASTSIQRWVVLTPVLERAITEAHLASDVLASDLDRAHTLAVPARAEARAALMRLIVRLRKAEPNANTVALRMGW